MQDASNLRVYNQVVKLVQYTYRIVDAQPISFKVRDQIFGSVGSIGACLAEFTAYSSDKMKAHKLEIAIGECCEAIFWFTAFSESFNASDAKYCIDELTSIKKQLIALYKSLSPEA